MCDNHNGDGWARRAVFNEELHFNSLPFPGHADQLVLAGRCLMFHGEALGPIAGEVTLVTLVTAAGTPIAVTVIHAGSLR
jgi:hypothetical protein